MINRIIPANDRRTAIVDLTLEGIGLVEQINSKNNNYYEAVLDKITENGKHLFINLFKEFVTNMENFK
jgi:DNA-binding MarR family transcriptional regulator